jgi:hypothetical protein
LSPTHEADGYFRHQNFNSFCERLLLLADPSAIQAVLKDILIREEDLLSVCNERLSVLGPHLQKAKQLVEKQREIVQNCLEYGHAAFEAQRFLDLLLQTTERLETRKNLISSLLDKRLI